MKCSKCGHEVPEGEVFCQFCGMKIEKRRGMNGVINELFPEEGSDSDASEDTNLKVSGGNGADEGVSKAGTIIQVIAVLIMIISVVGWLILSSDVGAPITITGILFSLLFGMICYGIGEICTTLKEISAKLK